MRDFVRDVASQVIAGTILACAGGIGVLLVGLTPMLDSYAPFSYFIAFLVSVILASVGVSAFVRMRSAVFPNLSSADAISPAKDDLETSMDLQEIDELFAKHFAPIAKRLSVIEGRMPLTENTVRKLVHDLAERTDRIKDQIGAENLSDEITANSSRLSVIEGALANVESVLEKMREQTGEALSQLVSEIFVSNDRFSHARVGLSRLPAFLNWIIATHEAVQSRSRIEAVLREWTDPDEDPPVPNDLIRRFAEDANALQVAAKPIPGLRNMPLVNLVPLHPPESWGAAKDELNRANDVLLWSGYDPVSRNDAFKAILETGAA